MNDHQHQFVLIEQITRRPKDARAVGGPVWQDEYGARCGCPLCGEIRVVWADGSVVVEVPGHYEQPRTTKPAEAA